VTSSSTSINTAVGLSSVEDVDDEVTAWLHRAYTENS